MTCGTDVSTSGYGEPAKMKMVNLAPNKMEKQIMLAGMKPSDILDAARAGVGFFDHQRKMAANLMRKRILKQNKKMEAEQEVVTDLKSQIARLEMEKEDLERELSKKVSAGHGAQLAFQFNGKDQVADDFPRTGHQANQMATFVDPDMAEIEFEDLDEEDFAPPSATNSHRETSQAVQSFCGITLRNAQVRLKKVDVAAWGLQHNRTLGAAQTSQVASRPWVRDAREATRRDYSVQSRSTGGSEERKILIRATDFKLSPMKFF